MDERRAVLDRVLIGVGFGTATLTTARGWHGLCNGWHDSTPRCRKGVHPMLYWAAVFFVIAIVAGIFGFAGIAASVAGIAKILFVVFLVLAGISLLTGGRRPAL
jgi:uncharacterized membrane protein YtjA (UPF0391 family)